MTVAIEREVSPAEALIAALHDHYIAPGRPPGGVFLPEVNSPDGSRRADALWAGLTKSGGNRLVGHEVKVSRADLAVELADPTKADPWLQYCDQWWLVVSDPRLIEGFTIPDAWGVMAPPSGRRRRTMTVVKVAPLLRPVEQGPGWKRVLASSHYRMVERAQAAERARNEATHEAERLRRNIAAYKESGAVPQAPMDNLAVKIAEGLRQRSTDPRYGHVPRYDIDPDDVIEAVLDLHTVRTRARDLARSTRLLADRTEQSMKEAARIAENLAALTEGPPQDRP